MYVKYVYSFIGSHSNEPEVDSRRALLDVCLTSIATGEFRDESPISFRFLFAVPVSLLFSGCHRYLRRFMGGNFLQLVVPNWSSRFNSHVGRSTLEQRRGGGAPSVVIMHRWSNKSFYLLLDLFDWREYVRKEPRIRVACLCTKLQRYSPVANCPGRFLHVANVWIWCCHR